MEEFFTDYVLPLIIMVGVKTFADVALHLNFDFGNLKKASQTHSTVTSRPPASSSSAHNEHLTLGEMIAA